MKKYLISLLVLCFLTSCINQTRDDVVEKSVIDKLINEWHVNAAEGHLEAYFDVLAEDFYFIGTDASEKWIKKDFKVFCEPHFADGSAWNFKPIKREIFFNEKLDFAWFDEQLNTQMGLCMSSGVLVITSKGWKIKHYQLSLHVPNEIVQDFMTLVETAKNTNIKN